MAAVVVATVMKAAVVVATVVEAAVAVATAAVEAGTAIPWAVAIPAERAEGPARVRSQRAP